MPASYRNRAVLVTVGPKSAAMSTIRAGLNVSSEIVSAQSVSWASACSVVVEPPRWAACTSARMSRLKRLAIAA